MKKRKENLKIKIKQRKKSNILKMAAVTAASLVQDNVRRENVH